MNYTLTIQNLVKNNVNIFDFPYNFYSEEHKKDFEEKFINFYYMEEIGFETIPLFKRYLRSELNRIYPYYEHLYRTTIQSYNMLENYNLDETVTRDITNNSQSNNDSTDFDTPRNNLNSPSFKNSTNNSISSNGKETLKRNTKGNIGVQTSQDILKKERDIIINIDDLILNELSDLFMGVYEFD